jgi:hypothetical protein
MSGRAGTSADTIKDVIMYLTENETFPKNNTTQSLHAKQFQRRRLQVVLLSATSFFV